ncbi:hypothetical protein D8674_013154 [Pyrus ussuriensis x Pyrus communis]|uniref:Integrase catalytic domain-containing protein n=1 Tax=Pyrus ussuriensis x Pyrus communis TaxID=2448454 RepID=A0A5N5GNY3_9ROSA|nr:hypothetical protein D8674_013154 [Pyrus ussuriensis x Pyrus communis]
MFDVALLSKLETNSKFFMRVFYKKVERLTNEALGLRKPINEATIVQKILKCLSKRFQAKKAAIQEFKDLNKIKLGKLVGKLITYEMELDMHESDSKKRKEATLRGVQNCEVVGDVSGPCFACGGSGHCSADCANTKLLGQKREKEMMVAWSDDNEQGFVQSDELSDDKEKVVTFVAPIEEVSLTDDDFVLNGNEDKTYDELCIKIKLDEKIGYLEAHVEELNGRAHNCNGKVEDKDAIFTLEAPDQVDRLIFEINRIAQLVHASSSGNIKLSSKWVENDTKWCLVVLNVVSFNKPNVWYLNKGCSHHMTEDNEAFSSIALFIGGGVMFGGGDKSQIIGKNDVKIPRLPKLENCHKPIDEASVLWHKGLGHVNFKDPNRLSKYKVPSLESFGDDLLPYQEKNKLNLDDESLLPIHHKKENLELDDEIATLNEFHSSIKIIALATSSTIFEDMLLRKKRRKHHHNQVLVEIQRTIFKVPQKKPLLLTKFLTVYKVMLNESLSSHPALVRIRTDHGIEFENAHFDDLCSTNGIKHKFSAPITPQQNGVVERKIHVLIEMTRVVLNSKNLAKHFWAEAMNIACYISYRVFLRPGTNVTPYELWRGKKPMLKYFKVFGSVCYIMRDREHLAKFDTKSDEAILLGYSNISRTYRVYNLMTKTIMEFINVKIDDTDIPPSLATENDDVLFLFSKDNSDVSGELSVVSESGNESELSTDQDSHVLFKDKPKWARGHRDEEIMGLIDKSIRTRRQITDEVANVKSHVVIAQVYVDDIVVGPTFDSLVKQFIDMMTSELEMSLVGELNYFLGLQVKQENDARMRAGSIEEWAPWHENNVKVLNSIEESLSQGKAFIFRTDFKGDGSHEVAGLQACSLRSMLINSLAKRLEKLRNTMFGHHLEKDKDIMGQTSKVRKIKCAFELKHKELEHERSKLKKICHGSLKEIANCLQLAANQMQADVSSVHLER